MKNFFAIITLSLIINISFSQKKIIGVVTDNLGEKLPGVSVLVKGTSVGTVTNINGKYSITVTTSAKYLVFSYIGMETIEKKITSDTINVQMLPSSDELEEVVVTSIGIRKGIKLRSFSSLKRHSKKYSPAASYYAEATRDDAVTEHKFDDSDINIKSGLLTSGELNDYGKWELWKDISDNQLKTYKTEWAIQAQERYCVQLTDFSNKPIVNAKVFLQTNKGDLLWSSLTDNTGKAELWANIFSENQKKQKIEIKVVYDGESFIQKKPTKFHDGINFISINAKCNVPKTADIAFVVDATGSMGDEISYLKVELEDVLKKIKENHKDIAVNTASVFYRDKTDNYLTKKSDFTEDVKTTIEFIKKQAPGGGGDFPEAVDAGLDVAINDLKWDNDALAKVIFLILDAPPHSDKESVKKIQELTKKASEKGIRIIPVTASGINKSTEYLMRSMALATNGTYVFLTDDSGIGNSHIKPTTDEYQVELLNDVFIRLIKQYLSIPECNEDIVYDYEEIKDTLFIADNSEHKDSLKVDTTSTTDITIKPKIANVKYYPNPTYDILNIEVSGKMKEMFLADVSGKILQRFDIKNQNYFQINLGNFPAGIYFIQYQNGERWKTGKIIKRKY